MPCYLVGIIAVAEESPEWAVERWPPGLVAAEGVASDFDVAAACVPGCGAVAWFPGDRDRAGPPRMVGSAFGGPGRHCHPASKTHIRICAVVWALVDCAQDVGERVQG